jgi:3-phosphoshikimate 1-carboxyvinyltransferase
MTATLTLGPLTHAEGSVALPGSKSISNRTLLLAALARGSTTIDDVLAADDTDRMLDALGTLGVNVVRDVAARRCVVSGVAGEFPVRTARLFSVTPVRRSAADGRAGRAGRLVRARRRSADA